MRPIPVPKYLSDLEWCEGTKVFAAPGGDLTSDVFPAVEAVFYHTKMEGGDDELIPMVGVVLQLEEPEIEAIKNGANHILLSWMGRRVPVFSVPEVISEEAIE